MENSKKKNLPLFREKNNICSRKDKLKVVSLKQENNLYSSLFVACQLRKFNLEELFHHENHFYPPSILEYGKLRKTNKADFLSCLDKFGKALLTCPIVNGKVIDGAAAIQMIKPIGVKAFGECASDTFSRTVLSCLSRPEMILVDIVFDRYVNFSLKGETRERRGKGVRLSVMDFTPIWKNWSEILKDDANKNYLQKGWPTNKSMKN